MVINSLNAFIKTMQDISSNNEIYIWGTGVYGGYLGKLFNDNNISWIGYFDNYFSDDKKKLNDKSIFDGKSINIDKNKYYILSMRNYNTVKEQLRSAGIDEEQIVCFEKIDFFYDLENVYTDNSVFSARIQKFHNNHSGKKCFIIGNGPSLIMDDLNKLNATDSITFASNLIFRCYENTSWRPYYYFFTDINGISDYLEEKDALKYVSDNCRFLFSRSNGKLKEYADRITNLELFRQIYSPSEEVFDFSDDCSEKVYIGYTVTYAMLQMAAYMDFSEIYLLGMDHSYSREVKADGSIVENHNIQDHSSLLKGHQSAYYNIDKTTLAFISAKKYADEHGIKIYNATRGGKLEVFPRVDFDSLFE